MKKNMKKIISSVMSFALIVSSVTTFNSVKVAADAPTEHTNADFTGAEWVKLTATGGDVGDVTEEYYINSDNVRVDEYDFIDRAINSIENTINKQIKKNLDRVEKIINVGIYRHYLPNSISIGNFKEYIMQYIHDMYKPNRIFKDPNKLCEIVKKYLLR